MPLDVGLHQLGHQIVAWVGVAIGGHLHRVHDQLDGRGHGVVGGELGVGVADHLIGPVEEFLALVLRNAHQSGNGLQWQFARHLLDEVTRALGRGVPNDRRRTLLKFGAQHLHCAWREGPRDDLAQVGVVRGVHIEQNELAALDVVGRGAFLVTGQRGVLQAGEDIAASRDLFHVFVFGDDPVAVVSETADAGRLLVPPDRRRPP